MAISEISIVDMPGIQFLGLRTRTESTDPEAISQALERAYGRLMQFMGRNQLEMAGPPICIYHEYGSDGVELEAGIPVDEEVEGDGMIRFGILPAGRAVHTLYQGHYNELNQAYDQLMRYVEDENISNWELAVEVYLTDPDQVPNPKDWETDIYLPLN